MGNLSLTDSKLVPFRRTNPLAIKGYESIIKDWLDGFTSPHTVRVYRQTLDEFFGFLRQELHKNDDLIVILTQFLLLDQQSATELVHRYENSLIEKKLTSATINRKLAGIKSFLNFAFSIGKCFYTLSNIKTKPVTKYRDTTGISSDSFKLILEVVDRTTVKGKRDYAMLLLLWGNALRRSELTNSRICDFEPSEKRLWIRGKGKQGQLSPITLGKETIKAIEDWLGVREYLNLNEPLFCAVHKGYWGHQLNPNSLYRIVRNYADLAGITKIISPHRLRHSAITAALDATNGDVRAVQKLSRHSSLNTLMVYDDNRRNEQGRVTDLLEDLL